MGSREARDLSCSWVLCREIVCADARLPGPSHKILKCFGNSWAEQMLELVSYLQTSTQRLSKDVSHVDDVGNTLRWLRDLRQREADLEQVGKMS